MSNTAVKIRPGVVHDKNRTLTSNLRQLAIKRGPDAKLPTVDEICALFETNRVSLSSALEDLEAQKVIYRRRGSGIYVSPQINRTNIAIVLNPDYFKQPHGSPFWDVLLGLLIQESQGRAESRNENCGLHFSTPHGNSGGPFDDGLANKVTSGQLTGVLGVGLTRPELDFLRDNGVPCIGFAGNGTVVVAVDIGEIARLGVRALAGLGCRRIAFWNPIYLLPGFATPRNADSLTDKEREPVTTFKEELELAGLPYCPQFTRDDSLAQFQHLRSGGLSHTLQDQGYQAVLEVFGPKSVDRPDGIVIENDMMADGVISAFHKLGVVIGRDVKLAAHANRGSAILHRAHEYMTVIEIDPEEIVKSLFDVLDGVLAGEAERPPVRIKPRVRTA